ncbi:MAG TPA: hypothetical protein PK011_05025 [Marinagarivorans sp.]|nr:hypothetical protein [Cellvibrionaceae bacterium]HMY38665.1 hypothetical protein [Marinagarivorans sp.]HNG60771.1 hypothetical protein [Cellvibrionaceae bacterium]
MKLTSLLIIAASQIAFNAQAGVGEFNFATLSKPSVFNPAAIHAHGCARKPGAEIAISGREFFNLQPGQVDKLAVDLTGTPGQKITLHISAENKGLMVQGPEEINLEVGSDQLASFNLPVKALLDGRWVINLIVHSETADGEVAGRALALVVQVGNMQVAGGGQQKATQSDAQGAPVIVLPAQEEIL